MKILLVGVGLALTVLAGCAASTTKRLGLPPLNTVAAVDLGRYAGTWYEIASYPQSFSKGCTSTTATYTARPDGDIDVLNRCRKGSLEGKEDTAGGRARVVDTVTHAKLTSRSFARSGAGNLSEVREDGQRRRAARRGATSWALQSPRRLPERHHEQGRNG